MQVANARSTEIRNFADNQYFASSAGLMPGGNEFLFEALIRVTGPAGGGENEAQQIFSNVDVNGPNTSGWELVRDEVVAGDTLSGQRYAIFRATVYNGAAGSLIAGVTLPLASILGKTILLTAAYSASNGWLVLYMNGAEVARDSIGESGFVFAPSPLSATIGFNPEIGIEYDSGSVLGASYTDAFSTDVAGFSGLDRALADRFLETQKRGMVPDTISSSSDADSMTFVFNAGNPGPVGASAPTQIINTGSAAPAGNMVKQGAGTTLIATAAQTEFACISAIVAG